MKTVTISTKKYSVQEIFSMAKKEALLIKTTGGDSYFVSLADDFESEVELLRNNHRFLSMLDKFKEEKETLSLDDVEKTIR